MCPASAPRFDGKSDGDRECEYLFNMEEIGLKKRRRRRRRRMRRKINKFDFMCEHKLVSGENNSPFER